jgi:hypothetical protein
MRALVFLGSATVIAACSIGALDGFSGDPLPDGGTPDATSNAGDGSSSTGDADGTTSTTDGPPTTSKYHAAIAADAPVVHFPLEETTGTACQSTVTTSAVCIYPQDKVTRGQPGVGGTKALRLEATTSALNITGLPGDLSGPYSYELWVRLDATAAGTGIGFFMNPATGAGDGFNLFLWDGARARTETWKAGALIAYGVASTAFTATVWHHFVITHSPGPHLDLFYVDGLQVESDTTNEASPRPLVTSPFVVTGFVGLVDEIAVYDKTLSPNRIAAHYAAQ